MKKFSDILEEGLVGGIIDFIKENTKATIASGFVILLGTLPSCINRISSIKFVVSLSLILLFAAFLMIAIIAIIALKGKNQLLKQRVDNLKHPNNPNVTKFLKGDIVVKKANKDKSNPSRLSIVDITSDKVICRTNDEDIIEYSPEELLTKEESEQVFARNRAVEQKKKDANNRLFQTIYEDNRR